MTRRVEVRFEGGAPVSVAEGTTLLDAARVARVALDAACAGLGTCGRCRVRARGELSAPAAEEVATLGAAAVADGWRLACRARALGAVTVEVPLPGTLAVVEGAALEPAWKPDADAEPGTLGVALDVGTTTVVAALVDLRSGDALATASALNAQHPWGADVMSRVAAAQRGEGEALHRALVEQADALIVELAQAAAPDADWIARIAAVGNTAMRGLLLGHDVTPLGAAPYEGVPLEAVTTTWSAAGGARVSNAELYALPCTSAFVGADAIAGLVAARLDSASDPRLFVDLGTNAEVVLWTGGCWLAASAAAGPALEGAGLSCGMRAVPGAIEAATLEEGDLRLETIGGAEPTGLCGSGALSLAAALLDAGILDASGRMRESAGRLGSRVVERDGQRAFVLDDAGALLFTQKDVRAVQLAKGAVRAAVELLLAEAGLAALDVAEVLVAGGFGRRLDGAALARTGTLPGVWRERLRFVGNAALEGARAALVSSTARAEAERLARRIVTLDLASDPRFQRRFVESLDFPSQ
ncbi:MAG: ASKHA domain-containing protein [Anaerosomatales bacterium]|nr:ASKHA domain-containing protein [Anaerosomatales bacterium]